MPQVPRRERAEHAPALQLRRGLQAAGQQGGPGPDRQDLRRHRQALPDEPPGRGGAVARRQGGHQVDLEQFYVFSDTLHYVEINRLTGVARSNFVIVKACDRG